jgi:hypothetical protein
MNRLIRILSLAAVIASGWIMGSLAREYFPLAPAFRGRVIASNQSPVANAAVYVNVHRATTDADGYFTIKLPRGQREFSLMIFARGFQSYRTPRAFHGARAVFTLEPEPISTTPIQHERN